VAQGAGVALMPERAAGRLADPARTRVLALTEPLFERPLHLCVLRRDGLPAHAVALLDFLRDPGDRPAGAAR